MRFHPLRLPVLTFALLSTIGPISTVQATTKISSQYEKITSSKCAERKSGDERIGYGACTTQLGPDLLIQYSEHAVWIYLNPAFDNGAYGKDNYSGPYTPGKSGHFGSLYEDKKKMTTLEWRVKQVDGAWQPFALIYRTTYSAVLASGNFINKQRLEVIKFGEDHACHLGFVEAQEANHNTKARAMADAAVDLKNCPPVL